jgi:hypothetical protein
MVSYTDNGMLEDHGNRFVCVLFFMARGVRDRGFDSDKVYGKLEMKGFDDQKQARGELVQFLEDQRAQRVQYDRTNNMVRLTEDGLHWAQGECDTNPVYHTYRHLQYSP